MFTSPSSTLNLGDRVGLGRVFFDVGDTAPGTYDITVTGGIPAGLSLLEDAFGAPVPFSVQPGSITVQAQAVPEPGFALPGLAVLAFGIRRRRRREARTARCC